MPQFITINKDVSMHDLNGGLGYLTFDSCCNCGEFIVELLQTEIVDISIYYSIM